ncbi:3-oxoacyl-[acyl-carrier-protein] reductase FabG [Bombyx mori]|uniref:Uncharacterized protein n=1 Tax=Bombyx mori TaxID=7091 RepID=A0A8R1WH67_BOMMO|nr:3-oxoacyl-[acyl-carrier-protein] reductase FabG [Bombyx mori]
MSYVGKVVLVTGGSAGIGAEIAVHFAREGADVAIVGRNAENLHKVAARCAKVGKLAFVIKADLSQDEDVRFIVKKTVEHCDRLDILVNNAAILKSSSIFTEDLMEAIDDIFKVNLRAVIQLTQLAVPHLTKTKGNIINISSILATSTLSCPQFLPYSVMKAGLEHFTRFSALELAPSGIRVNAVCPGPVKTEILNNAGIERPCEKWEKLSPLKRIAQPEDVAEVVLFLANAKSVTGSYYVIDNGLKISF